MNTVLCFSFVLSTGIYSNIATMFVHVCIGSTDEFQHRLSMWQHVLGACIKHSHEMEVRHDATAQQWQNGREEKKNIAMHCTEMNEVMSA